MSYDFVGLENLPNVYIEKISLSDNNDQTFRVDIDILLLDEVFENFFVWSDDDLLYDYTKVALIATSNEDLISGISEGAINSHPSLLKNDRDLMRGTEILTTSPKQTTITSDVDTRRYSQRMTLLEPVGTSTMALFAFSYIDTQELSNALRIALTGPLSHYMGSVTSEYVLKDKEIQRTTSLYRVKGTNEIWSGPIHFHEGKGYMVGSYHSENPHPSLTRVTVDNTKIVDHRSVPLDSQGESTTPQKPAFSTLSESFTNEADFIGTLSLDLRSVILSKTKYGRKMFSVSRDLFETFSRSVVINSLEIRRQQVKLRSSINRLGTRRFQDKLIGSYKTIAASVEENGNLVNTPALSQIYITPDPLIKTYQFIDEDMSEKTRGEFRYEVIATFMDKSQDFLLNMISQMELNISDLKVQQEFLFRPQRYDRKNNKLRAGTQVPTIFNVAIDNYFQNLSLISVISDEEKIKLVKNKKASFKSGNYMDREATRFIAEYSALVTKLRNRFDLQKKVETLSGGTKPSRMFVPAMMTVNRVFDNIIKFDNVTASYDFLGIQSNKSIASFTKDGYTKRANLEATRFFDLKKSTVSNDLIDLEPEDMDAIKDLDSAKFGFLSPISFKFKSQTKDLTSLQDLDSDGISTNFINHITERQSDPRFTSAPVKKIKKSPPKKSNKKTRRVFKKKRVGRTKFNFKRTPFKINNLKNEEHLEVSKFLGPNSEMVNVESKLDESTPAPQTEQVQTKLLATQGLSVKRQKISFDLQSKNNIFEKFKSSPKFNRHKLKMMPVSIKALINSRSTAAKNNILQSDSDILKDAETKISTEMIFHASQRVEYFAGFDTDINGLPDVSQPNWEEVTPIALENNSRLMCRMRYTEIPELDIKPAQELKLLALNSMFVISNEDIGSRMLPQTTLESNLEIDLPLPEVDDIVFASSNFVKQNEDRKNQLIDQVSPIQISNTQQVTGQQRRSNIQAPPGGTRNAPTSRY